MLNEGLWASPLPCASHESIGRRDREERKGLTNHSCTSRSRLTSFPIILMVGATVDEEVADGGAIVLDGTTPASMEDEAPPPAIIVVAECSGSIRTDSLSKLILTWDQRLCSSLRPLRPRWTLRLLVTAELVSSPPSSDSFFFFMSDHIVLL